MSTLGEILDQLQDPSEVRRLMMDAGDISMATHLESAARERGEDAGSLALHAIDSFTKRAGDEDWVKLIGRIQNADAPAAACLSEMLQWALAH